MPFNRLIYSFSTSRLLASKNFDRIFHREASFSKAKRPVPKFHRKMIKTAVKVYQPGEYIPQPGDRNPVEKMPLPSSVLLKSTTKKDVGEMYSEEASDELFTSVMGEVVMTKGRKLLALEGNRLIVEALSAGLKLEKLFMHRNNANVPQSINKFITASSSPTESNANPTEDQIVQGGAQNSQISSVEIVKVSQKRMESWSSLTTPPGVVGIFKRPTLKGLTSALPVTVICDNIREPGNVGALLRAAAGAGCKRVLLSKGCCNVWDGKVLRAASGAHFYMPITEEIPIHSIGSHMNFESDGKEDNDDKSSGAVDTDDVENFTEGKMQTSTSAIFLADCNRDDPRYRIPIRSYSSVDYTKYKNIYIVVGGEAEGLSNESKQIATVLSQSQQPALEIQRLQIPMQCKLESLNVAHAFAVIIFEILRQRKG